jgi:hypothetical protein
MNDYIANIYGIRFLFCGHLVNKLISTIDNFGCDRKVKMSSDSHQKQKSQLYSGLSSHESSVTNESNVSPQKKLAKSRTLA